MDNSNVMDIINKPSEKYTTKELIDFIKKNSEDIFDLFSEFYNELANEQNVYTKFSITLCINGETKKYDLNNLIECKDDIQHKEISDYRIYVCSCSKSTLDNYLFSSLDMTITNDYKIRVNYFDEFDSKIVKKYVEKIKSILGNYCYFICYRRDDDNIKSNESDDYEMVLSSYQKKLENDNKNFVMNDEFNKVRENIDKRVNGLDETKTFFDKKRTSIQYQLSNVVLFDYVFNYWYMFNQLLSLGPESMKKFLFDEWNRVKDVLLKQNKFIINDAEKKVTKDDFDITVNKTSKGTMVYFFAFPDYEFTDAASKYVALALTFGKPRYFTLEYSIHYFTNTPTWVIGEFYIKDHNIAHRNYGSVDNMRLSYFAGYVLEILDDFEGAKKKTDEHEKKFDGKDNQNILLISESGKYEYTLLGKKYDFIATKKSDSEIEIEVSDYGLAQKREDGSISLLDKVKRFSVKKGERISLRTQTNDYGEEVVICWN